VLAKAESSHRLEQENKIFASNHQPFIVPVADRLSIQPFVALRSRENCCVAQRMTTIAKIYPGTPGSYTNGMSDPLQSMATAAAHTAAQVILPPGPMTAEQYGCLPDLGYPTELVRGQIKVMNQPYPSHGAICATITMLLCNFVRQRKLGHVVTNDSGVITERQPDTVRGPDVAYFSYERVPPGRLPRRGYLDAVPELAIEVKSVFDRWSEIDEKIAEYLKAGVLVVCVVDPDTDSVQVHSPNQPMRVVQRDEDLLLPEVLPDFRVTVRELFE
jgi:Uma2 family endonuclease